METKIKETQIKEKNQEVDISQEGDKNQKDKN